ncbi:MAG: Betaine aldehyde dehydrogenase [Syntrophorhabdaceae bacterium PtaU1.Bin034]|jgi:aldehyde dehydrogenase (NAD+)|nr:MAG: Betaine aldehyde dehydrogenase [Syntrophorhabdaceae bacterium PtaU1.Bin034]
MSPGSPEFVRYRMFIDGEWVDAGAGRFFESLDPFTGRAWATIPDAEEQDADRAVKAARDALDREDWKRMPPMQRGHLLRRLADLLADNAERLARTDTRDNGKLIREMLGQAKALPGYYHYYAGLADKILGQTIPLENRSIFNYTLREPVGVVAIITPWNSPLLILSFSLAAALATGNTVVVKPSEYASASTLEFAKIVGQAGFPKGVFNVVTGFGKTSGSALVSHSGVDKVVFTGGVETGKVIARTAAGNITATLLELGGKSPNIVFDDADIPDAVNGCIAGIFAAAGQTCIAGSRLFLHEKIHDEFVERLVERTRTIKLGDPSKMESEMGPMATMDQLNKVKGFVGRAIKEGGTLVYGGRQPEDDALRQGWFFMPTIFTGMRDDMNLSQEEVFGPVLAVMKFRDDEEVVARANRVRYGLAAGIWTRDIKRAHRVAQELKAGTVWINTYRALSYASPFGGYKQSGYGREMGVEALREFTQVKSVWVNLADTTPDPFVIR